VTHARSPIARVATAAIALTLGLGGALVAASPASATDFTVSSGADSGPGSLNEAIGFANADTFLDTITIDYAGTIALTTPLPDIQSDLTIIGTNGVIIDGAGTPLGTPGLEHTGCDTTLTVSGVTIRNFDGDGIHSTCGSLYLTTVESSGNGESGLYAYGSDAVSVIDSTFSSNGVQGIDIRGNTAGMQTTVTNVSVEDNGGTGAFIAENASGALAALSGITANDNAGPGIHLESNPGIITLTSAASSGNADGIQIYANGPAATSSVTVSNSTASGNVDFGVYVQAIEGGATASVSDVTADLNGNTNVYLSIVQGAGSTLNLTRVVGDSSVGSSGLYAWAQNSGQLSIADSEFSGNYGGGGSLGSDVSGEIHITGTEFSDNNLSTPFVQGGGLYTQCYRDASITVADSTVADNHAVEGGGIYAATGSCSVAITNTIISGNDASASDGGGIFVAGSADARAGFLLADSTVTGNTSGGDGGGLSFVGSGGASAGLSIQRTTISGNSAVGTGGGIALSNWGWNNDSDLPGVSIEQSTISGNDSATGAGIGADNQLTANAFGDSAELWLLNSTVSGNTASNFIGAVEFSAASDSSPMVIAHSTVVSNTGGSLGGVRVGQFGALSVYHSVIANNGTQDLVRGGVNTTLIPQYSLIEAPDASSLTTMGLFTGNISGVDPKLGALANNGGPTLTHLPLTGSPLIDAGDPAITGAPATDQRGFARIYQVIDIGAVETQALAATGTDAATPLTIGLVIAALGALMLFFAARRRSRGA
jgi:hypothetical protein